MPKLGIQDLAAVLAQKKGLTKAQAERFVGAMFDVVNYGLDTERLVKVKGFGTFKVTNVKDRESINVNTGERVVISGHGKVGFTPETVLRDMVNKPFAQFETVVLNDGVDFSQVDDAVDEPLEVESESESKPEEAVVAEDISADLLTLPQKKEVKEEQKDIVEAKDSSADEIKKEGDTSAVHEPKNDNAESIDSPSVLSAEEDKSESESSAGDNSVSCTPQGNEKKTQEVESVSDEDEAEEDDVKSTSRGAWKLIAVCVAFVCLAAVAGLVGFYFGSRQQSPMPNAVQSVPQKSKTLVTKQKVVKRPSLAKHSAEAKPKEVGVSTTAKSDVEKTVTTSSVTSATTPEKTSLAEKTTAKDTQKSSVLTASKYDQMDVRVRTGAYAIVGVNKIVTAKNGETLKGISDRNLGTGMECYVEVLNGTRNVKAGDKIKIPELVLKKRMKR